MLFFVKKLLTFVKHWRIIMTTEYNTCLTNAKEDADMRKTRSDCRVGAFEKKHGLPPGTIRNKDGRDTRSDKKIGTIRKENRR